VGQERIACLEKNTSVLTIGCTVKIAEFWPILGRVLTFTCLSLASLWTQFEAIFP